MTITLDNQGIHEGETTIPWGEVSAVAIRTTSDGPYVEDLFWMFRLTHGVIEVPGSLVSGAALGVMQEQLPNLDSLKVISAMGSTSERIFRVWHAEDSRTAWDTTTFAARFAALVERLGGRPDESVFDRLSSTWAANERSYHTLEHLADCLRELDMARAEPAIADVAELALWYHDAVYAPLAHDNEERSAALLLEDARAMLLPPATAEAAAACIRATAHLEGATPSGCAAELVVDIDLAILGREALRFMDFEYAVAEEYAAVSWTRYILGRGRFLADLLARPSIFRTQYFRARYEESAKANISHLLASRRYRLHRLLGGLYRRLK